MSSPPPQPRKRKLAKKLADDNNVAEPVLKQQRLEVQRRRKARVDDEDDVDSELDARGPAPHNSERILEAADGSDDDLPPTIVPPNPSTSANATRLQAPQVIEIESDAEDILKEFVAKPKGQKKSDGGNGRKEHNAPSQAVETCQSMRARRLTKNHSVVKTSCAIQ